MGGRTGKKSGMVSGMVLVATTAPHNVVVVKESECSPHTTVQWSVRGAEVVLSGKPAPFPALRQNPVASGQRH